MRRVVDKYVWEELIAYTCERQVIPIVGPQVLRGSRQGGSSIDNFEGLLTRGLAAELGLTFESNTALTLNEVVCRHLEGNGQRQAVFPRLLSVLREARLTPSPMLEQLASIADLPLFVSTTFDGLLAQALAPRRGEPLSLSYAPNRVTDLPPDFEQCSQAIVYHLLGKLTATPSCVFSDEDLLEFMTALQTRNYQPERLFQALESRHLVLLGTGLPDWLCRLLLRVAKRQRLSQERDMMEIVVDDSLTASGSLANFLQHFSSRTYLYPGSLEEFIAEWLERWRAAVHPPVAAIASSAEPSPPTTSPGPSVFISYAREDLQEVKKLHAALLAAGIPAWFDMQQLEAGDAYDLKIRNNISRCAFFVPIVSANTQRRLRGWFRREWSYAAEQAREYPDDYPFILPVLISDLTQGELIVPERFKQAHIVKMPGGDPGAEFLARMKQLLKEAGAVSV